MKLKIYNVTETYIVTVDRQVVASSPENAIDLLEAIGAPSFQLPLDEAVTGQIMQVEGLWHSDPEEV